MAPDPKQLIQRAAQPQEGQIILPDPGATLDDVQMLALRAQMDTEMALLKADKITLQQFSKRFERKYMRLVQRRSTTGANIHGARLIDLNYMRGDEIVPLTAHWIPGPAGPKVVFICPECFIRAPASVDVNRRTKATFFEQRLMYMKGDPQADAKLVQFMLQWPVFHMWLDSQDRLTVREQIACISGRHGKEERAISPCDARYRLADSILQRVNRRLAPGGKTYRPTKLVMP